MCGGLGVGHGEDEAGEACGDAARAVPGWGTSAAAGTGSGASWLGEALADGESTAEADGGGAADAGMVFAGVARGAAAAPWPPPSVSVSAMPSPVTASTAAASAAPDRKLISSMRALIARLSLLPSLTTKHDTRWSAAFVGSR